MVDFPEPRRAVDIRTASAANPNVPPINDPVNDLGSLTQVVKAIRQGVQSLAGARGNPLDRAVTFRDLITLGLAASTDAVASSLTVKDVDGDPLISNVSTIVVGGDLLVSDEGAATAEIAIDVHTARVQLQWAFGAVVADGAGFFCDQMPYPGTINYLRYFTGNDTFDVVVDIAGTPVTGLDGPVAVSSATPATATATAANHFSAGAAVGVTISGTTGAPTDALLLIGVTWDRG